MTKTNGSSRKHDIPDKDAHQHRVAASICGLLPPFMRTRCKNMLPRLIALSRTEGGLGSRFVKIQLKLLALSLVTSVHALVAVQEVLQAALIQLRQIQDENEDGSVDGSADGNIDASATAHGRTPEQEW